MYWRKRKSAAVVKALSIIRRDMLDLNVSNGLLSYSPSPMHGVPQLLTTSEKLFTTLTVDRKDLIFLGPGEHPQPAHPWGTAAVSSSDDYLEFLENNLSGFSAPVEELPESVMTTLPRRDLDLRLLATFYVSRASVEEEGCVTLYVAFGSMHWRSPDEPHLPRVAPLLLVPVQLERKTASSEFRLRYTGDDILPNMCLAELLKRMDVDLPAWNAEPGMLPRVYFDQVRRALKGKAGLQVDGEFCTLGIFSFAKIVMYRDLEAERWPREHAIAEHEVLNRLIGDEAFEARPQSEVPANLDGLHSKQPPHHVLDADASQSTAILDIAKGSSVIIEGPPGTGKSQTIVNIIADFVARNKRVLFVSEKLAALEVVQQRLQSIGLGDTLLEMHSSRARSKAVFHQLRRTLEARTAFGAPSTFSREEFHAVRDRLNEYSNAVNTSTLPSGESAIEVYGALLRNAEKLRAVTVPALSIEGASQWTPEEIQARRHAIDLLQDALGQNSVPSTNPFWGASAKVFLPTTRENIRIALGSALLSAEDTLVRLRVSARAVAQGFALPQPETWRNLLDLHAAAEAMQDAPDMVGLRLNAPAWKLHHVEIAGSVRTGLQLQELMSNWGTRLRPEVMQTSPAHLELLAAGLEKRGYKYSSGPLENALHELVAGELPSRPKDVQALLQAVMAIHQLRNKLQADDLLMADAFGPHWRKENSNFVLLRSQVEWINARLAQVDEGTCPTLLLEVAGRTQDRSVLARQFAELKELLAAHLDARNHLLRLLNPDAEEGASLAILNDSNGGLDGLQSSYQRLQSQTHDLGSLARYMKAREAAQDLLPETILAVADSWPHASKHLGDVFERARLNQAMEQLFVTYPVLADFDLRTHTRTIERFRALDEESLRWSRESIRKSHRERITTATACRDEMEYIRNLSEKPGAQPSVRQLMTKAPRAIQVLKPVFMMSPSSVASFLPADVIHFDLVIFDEASQLRPADALGSIARAEQAVVVGDSNQLPPSRFFQTASALEGTSDAHSLADVESILTLFASRGASRHTLQWHYRSKHESLIALSNQLFYKEKMIVFPSPDRRRTGVGLVTRKVLPQQLVRFDGPYNRREACLVARAVMAHAADQLENNRQKPLSLGVATLNVRQRDLILEEVDRLRRENPDSEEFFSQEVAEPFFVSNLENVQGNERDVVYISIGLQEGSESSLSQKLGPLARKGGDRRLNVLFTRARQRCEVFTALDPSRIDLAADASDGVVAFRRFLQYAENGRLSTRPPVITERAQDQFEAQVAAFIEKLGYTVKRKVGVAGYYLDLAVVDPHEPDAYILGLMCDGSTYAAARTCRDRDRLIETALSSVGWTFHRVWSTSWYHSRESEIDRLAGVLLGISENARARKPQPVVSYPEPPAVNEDEDAIASFFDFSGDFRRVLSN